MATSEDIHFKDSSYRIEKRAMTQPMAVAYLKLQGFSEEETLVYLAELPVV